MILQRSTFLKKYRGWSRCFSVLVSSGFCLWTFPSFHFCPASLTLLVGRQITIVPTFLPLGVMALTVAHWSLRNRFGTISRLVTSNQFGRRFKFQKSGTHFLTAPYFTLEMQNPYQNKYTKWFQVSVALAAWFREKNIWCPRKGEGNVFQRF